MEYIITFKSQYTGEVLTTRCLYLHNALEIANAMAWRVVDVVGPDGQSHWAK